MKSTTTLSCCVTRCWGDENLSWLGREELAPPTRGDGILDNLAGSWCHELNATRALLTVFGTVLVFGGFVGKFGLREQDVRHSVRGDDGANNCGYSFQYRAATNALIDRAGWIVHASTPCITQK